MKTWQHKALVGLLSFSLLFAGIEPAFAGKSYSGGSSRSSGGSSRSSSGAGRSSSFGSSSHSGRSYSGGSSTRSSGSSFSSKPSSSGKSYSGGSSSKSGSGSSWFGSSSSSKSTAPKPSYSSPSPSKSSGSSWFGSSSTSKGRSSTVSTDGQSRKPSGQSSAYGSNNFNSTLTRQGQQAGSASTFKTKPALAPASTFTSAGGKTVNVNPTAPSTQTVRNYVTHERYVTYDYRASSFFGPTYYGHPWPVYYHDPYSSFFWGWFWGSTLSANDRAIYIYNHQSEMDQQRVRDAYAKDAELEKRVRTLESANAAKDPNYVPSQLADNPDLQYDPNFVKAAYNPIVEEPPPSDWSGFWKFMRVILYISIGIVVISLVKYFVFDFGHDPKY